MSEMSWPAGVDREFEEFIKTENERVAQSARFMYYGSAHRSIFGPPVRPPVPPGRNPREMRPLHTIAEIDRSNSIVTLFNKQHPGRKRQLIENYMAQVGDDERGGSRP